MLLVVIVAIHARRYEKRSETYHEIAEELGLTIGKEGMGKPLHLEGRIGGLDVRLEETVIGRITNDKYTVGFPQPLPGELRIVNRSLEKRFLAWFRRNKVFPLEHQRFDDHAIVSGNDEFAVRGFLNERRREAIIAALVEFPSLEIHHDRLVWTEMPPQTEADEIRYRIDRFVEIAKDLTGL